MLGSHFGKQRETELPQSLGRRQHSAPEQKVGLSALIYVAFPDPGPVTPAALAALNPTRVLHI